MRQNRAVDGPRVEDALAELESVVRQPMGDQEIGADWYWQGIPYDLAGDKIKALHLPPVEQQALRQLRLAVIDDMRFERLDDRAIDEATWRFVCLSYLRRDESHVDWFMAEYASEVMQRECFFPVLHLAVTEGLDLGGARLIPADDVELPQRILGPDPKETMASAIAVECTGADYNKMVLRATEIAKHRLRVLRAGLREERWMPDRQLRFELGQSVWFDDGASGWSHPPTLGWDYTLDAATFGRAMSVPVASLSPVAASDVDECANRALKWWEQAHLAVDDLMETLFLFFALEAILGSSRGPKARPLALRRAILGHKTTGGFAHPNRVYGLYKDVRNAAVHGGDPPKVADDELQAFASDARRALNEYLDFARAEKFTERDQLLAALDADPGIDEIAERFLPEVG
ncbi:MAG: hypothetical protein QOI03_1594 [Solirubrobacteraceae bacterium]|jgi:hypothetical protein|nr:hypothetical protein [Solirubrobacteraceae bacterium]